MIQFSTFSDIILEIIQLEITNVFIGDVFWLPQYHRFNISPSYIFIVFMIYPLNIYFIYPTFILNSFNAYLL